MIWSNLGSEVQNEIWSRFNKGESVDDLASEYDIKASSLSRKFRLIKQRFIIERNSTQESIDYDLIINDTKKIFVYADPHFGKEDESALSAALKVAERFQPDIAINLGDTLDGSDVSRFKDVAGQAPSQYERDAWGEWCEKFNTVTNTEAHFVLLGNHDLRYRYAINEVKGFAEIEELSMQSLLYEEELGLTVVDSIRVNPTGDELYPDAQLYFDHGMAARKWAGKSVQATSHKMSTVNMIIGHAHRTAHLTQASDRGIIHMWEVGCLRNLKPSFDRFPDWSQSLLTGIITPDFFDFHAHMIDRGRTWLGGVLL